MNTEENIKRIAVITGASRGIGAATGERFIKEGWLVYDLSRSGGKAGLRHIACDVSRPEDIENALKLITEENGRIDAAISNAGFGIAGSLECASYEDIKRQIAVNFSGSAYFAKAVIPHIRRSRGRLIFVSSLAGAVPIPFQSLYSATKAALISMALALDNEIKPSGARAAVILPGDLATGFTAARKKNPVEAPFYEKRVAASLGRMERDEMNGKSPAAIADKIYKIAVSDKPSAVSSSGAFYRLALLLVKILPAAFYNRIIFKLYGK